MAACIFCLRKNVKFNQEHVIPRGFGRFGSKTPTFSEGDEIVCQDCNQEFGDKIDRRLSRETAEGLKRLQKQERQSEMRPDYVKQVKFYVKTDNKPSVDVYIEPLAYLQEGQVNPLAQARLVKRNNEVIYVFERDELKTKSVEDFKKKGWHIFAPSRDVADEWESILIGLGFDASRKTTMEPQSDGARVVEVHAHSIIDEEIMRSIAKMGFEFLVYRLLKTGDFSRLDVCSDKFAKVRDFIRGEKRPGNPTELFEFGKPLLAQESERVTLKTDGIIVMTSVKQGLATSSIRIYDLFSYTIILSRDVDPSLTVTYGMFFKPGEEAEELYARKTNLVVCVVDLDNFGRPYFRQV